MPPALSSKLPVPIQTYLLVRIETFIKHLETA